MYVTKLNNHKKPLLVVIYISILHITTITIKLLTQ